MDTKIYQEYFTSFGMPIYRSGGKGKKKSGESGSGIHINPKNEGKFTEQASRAGMGVQEFASHVLAHKENYDGVTVRRANFARNARKFKHQSGGRFVGRLQPGGFVPNNPDEDAAYLQAYFDRIHPDISNMTAAQNEEDEESPAALSPSQSFTTDVNVPASAKNSSSPSSQQRSLYSLDRKGRRDFRKTGNLYYDSDSGYDSGNYTLYSHYSKPDARKMSRESARLQRAENRFDKRIDKNKVARWNSGRFSDEANAMHNEMKQNAQAAAAQKRYFGSGTQNTGSSTYSSTSGNSDAYENPNDQIVVSRGSTNVTGQGIGNSNSQGGSANDTQIYFNYSTPTLGSQMTGLTSQQIATAYNPNDVQTSYSFLPFRQ